MANTAPSAPHTVRRWVSRGGRALGRTLFYVVALATLAWMATALYVHFSDRAFGLVATLLALGALGILYGRTRSRRAGWIGLGLVALCFGGWYQTLRPSDTRVWASDVARGVKTDIAGDIVTLRDIRTFRWQDENTANEAWKTQAYDLGNLSSVDMLTSVWDNPDIAHILVSFGFSGNEHVVFSVEIRREKGEEFSALGGFFRQFEMVLIAADEEDIVKLRTNYRDEDVRLYPIKLDPAQMRRMFLAYTQLGNDLAAEPAFYNTILANCTTTVYQLAKVIKPDMPLDIRLIKSGHLSEYLADLGGLQQDLEGDTHLVRNAITQLAQSASGEQNFSDAIRVEREE